MTIALAPTPGPAQSRREPEPLLRDVFGAALRRERVEQGRTLREVAHDSTVSLAYLSEIERGRKEPSSEVLAAVCAALDLKIFDLVNLACIELGAQVVSAHHLSAPMRGTVALAA